MCEFSTYAYYTTTNRTCRKIILIVWTCYAAVTEIECGCRLSSNCYWETPLWAQETQPPSVLKTEAGPFSSLHMWPREPDNRTRSTGGGAQTMTVWGGPLGQRRPRCWQGSTGAEKNWRKQPISACWPDWRCKLRTRRKETVWHFNEWTEWWTFYFKK